MWDSDLEDTHTAVIYANSDVTQYNEKNEAKKVEFSGIASSALRLEQCLFNLKSKELKNG